VKVQIDPLLCCWGIRKFYNDIFPEAKKKHFIDPSIQIFADE